MPTPHGIRAGAAYVELFLDDSKLSRGLKRAQKKLKAFGTSIQDMGKKMALAGTVISTGLGLGVGAFANFEEAMARVATILDDADQYLLPGFAKGVRQMSVEFGKSSADIAAGLYDLIGSGVKASDAMNVLRVALAAAVAGNTDTATATRVLTATLNAYNIPASQAAAVSDVLFQTVNRGVISFEELSNSAGNVLSIANTAGLKFNALAAAIATMTRAGITGDTAITNLRNILTQFISASPQAQAMAQKYGFSLNSATLQGEGLLGVLEKLKGASNADLATIFPDVRGLSGFPDRPVRAVRPVPAASRRSGIIWFPATAAHRARRTISMLSPTTFLPATRGVLSAPPAAVRPRVHPADQAVARAPAVVEAEGADQEAEVRVHPEAAAALVPRAAAHPAPRVPAAANTPAHPVAKAAEVPMHRDQAEAQAVAARDRAD